MLEPPTPWDEAKRIARLRSLQILDTPAEERFDRITRTAMAIFKVPIALLSLIDSDRQWFKSCHGLPVRETSREVSFCGHTILRNDPLIVEDATQDERFATNPLVRSDPSIRFYAGWPIRLDEGSALGTLCVIDRKPRVLSLEEIAILEDLANVMVDALRGMELSQKVKELDELRAQVSSLEGLLPICSYCKRIRNDDKYWERVESYVARRTGVDFTHGVCPPCFVTAKQQLEDEIRAGISAQAN